MPIKPYVLKDLKPFLAPEPAAPEWLRTVHIANNYAYATNGVAIARLKDIEWDDATVTLETEGKAEWWQPLVPDFTRLYQAWNGHQHKMHKLGRSAGALTITKDLKAFLVFAAKHPGSVVRVLDHMGHAPRVQALLPQNEACPYEVQTEVHLDNRGLSGICVDPRQLLAVDKLLLSRVKSFGTVMFSKPTEQDLDAPLHFFNTKADVILAQARWTR